MTKITNLVKISWDFLAGKKTYLVAFLFIVLAGLKGEGYIDTQTHEIIVGILAAAGIATVRHSISRIK